MSDAGHKTHGASKAHSPLKPGGLLAYLASLLTGRSHEEAAELARADSFDAAARALDGGERAILLNLVQFGDLRVQDVMVPRAEITGIELSTPLNTLAAVFAEAAHSRLPVYRGTLDDPVGMVHVKDVLRVLIKDSAPGEPVLAHLKREVLYVPPSMRAVDLLAKMQKTRIHMALVIDEYGGTDGLVTIEDIVEQIVGDIEDEHDSEDPAMLTQLPDGSFEANARLLIEDFNEALGLNLPVPESGEGADTLGGLLIALAGQVPPPGAVIAHPAGLAFEVLDADPSHVKTVRVDVSGRGKTADDPAAGAALQDPASRAP